ncbi:hypothetical protein B1Q24_24695 [Salmonella enterica subsp. enterica serovar Agona]|nr:hypothetical protein [Salmonella enterica subsp. enterica serovar Agona]EDF8163604.1 hypothetical protein [Salmonella enterica subsp. enterica serovar Agona]
MILYSRHTVGTPNILVRAAPRHPPTPHGTRKNSAYRSPFSLMKTCRFDQFDGRSARNRSRICLVHSYATRLKRL